MPIGVESKRRRTLAVRSRFAMLSCARLSLEGFGVHGGMEETLMGRRRRGAGPSEMDYVEALAKRIVETARPGLFLRFETDQSSSVADFSIERCKEKIGVLEVTRSTVQGGEEIRKLIGRAPFIERKLCESDWLIHLGEGVKIDDVRKQADRYLREIETSGLEEFFYPTDGRIKAVHSIWEELRVEGGAKTKWKRPGIVMLGPSSGGCASSEAVWAAARAEAYKADNLRKLGASPSAERHLFVYIDGLQGPAYVSIRYCEPPDEAPDLPPEISHVWLATEEGSLAYVWLADSMGWQDLTDIVNKAR